MYVDKNVKDVYSQLAFGVFSDTVYEKVKELYENQFDEDNEGQMDISNIDDSAFGFDLDSNKTVIGHFYIFLMTIYNLIPVGMDKTPIIDNKG